MILLVNRMVNKCGDFGECKISNFGENTRKKKGRNVIFSITVVQESTALCEVKKNKGSREVKEWEIQQSHVLQVLKTNVWKLLKIYRVCK